ncbi:hypothetical protein GGR67_002535 [Xanthomonas arboricola]|nr:hypothetical protein [Xanthomonas euroxanthea]
MVGAQGKSGARYALIDHDASTPRLVQSSLQTVFQVSADQLSGAASLPVAGPCGGMDAATEPPGTGSRRVPQAVRAPRPRRCGLAAGPLPAHHRGTRRESVHGGSYAASMPRKVPRRWAGKDQARWSECAAASRAWLALFESRCARSVPAQAEQQAGFRHEISKCLVCRCKPSEMLSISSRLTSWGGVLAGCGTVWRHGCRHRARRDGFTACPASGEGAAPSTT